MHHSSVPLHMTFHKPKIKGQSAQSPCVVSDQRAFSLCVFCSSLKFLAKRLEYPGPKKKKDVHF